MKKKYRKKRPVILGEQYEIVYDIKKPDGFWSHSLTELVSVPVPLGGNEKNKHDEARRIFEKKFPKARVTGVRYL